MEKTYKHVPFDIELAKKIQSGEIEGKIVTNGGFNIRILCLDRNYTDLPIVALVNINKSKEQVISYNTEGATNNPDFIGCRQLLHLCIELPEEASKSELKEGDKPRLVCPECLKSFDKCKSQPAYHNRINYECPHCGHIDDSVRFETDYSWHPYNKTKKQKFKPFDKVLVRMSDDEIWKVSLYGFKRDDGTHCCINTSCWEQCIPYEGNEHLLGTTNEPK